MNATVDKSSSPVLEKSPVKGRWTYVIPPGSAEHFGTRGLVQFTGTVEQEPFHGSFMALGDRRHRLAFAADVRDRMGRPAADEGVVTLAERSAR